MPNPGSSAAPDALVPCDGSPKRRLVLEAARALFLAHGYGAVSMDAVARQAGVSKATLYAHFSSKDALFATIMGEYALPDMISDELLRVPVHDLRAALEAIGRTMLGFLVREETLALIRVAVAEAVRFPELGRSFYAGAPQRGEDRLHRWIADQQAAGRVRADADARTAAQQLMALLRSVVFMRAAFGLTPPPAAAEIERTVTAAADTWLRAFAA